MDNMEYFELIRTVEFDVEVETQTKIMRVELLKSNVDANKYRAKLLEITDYNLYPTMFNSGPEGEDLHKCHSADRIWRELLVMSEELYLGFVSEDDESALKRVVKEGRNVYSSTKN